jgi:uncharacterized membrane protein
MKQRQQWFAACQQQGCPLALPRQVNHSQQDCQTRRKKRQQVAQERTTMQEQGQACTIILLEAAAATAAALAPAAGTASLKQSLRYINVISPA